MTTGDYLSPSLTMSSGTIAYYLLPPMLYSHFTMSVHIVTKIPKYLALRVLGHTTNPDESRYRDQYIEYGAKKTIRGSRPDPTYIILTFQRTMLDSILTFSFTACFGLSR